jgi:Fe2+ or Zn2+ uptake regulation protein
LAQKLTTGTGRLHHPNSIYRMIATLHKRGHVVPVAFAKGWAIRTVAGDYPVCRKCGRSWQIPAPEIEAGLGEILARRRFEPRLLHPEVIGHCQACTGHTPDS